MAEDHLHCPLCGYTEQDARIHMDHRLCKNDGNAPWQRSSAGQAKIPEGEERPTETCKCQYPDFWGGHGYCGNCGKPAKETAALEEHDRAIRQETAKRCAEIAAEKSLGHWSAQAIRREFGLEEKPDE